MLMAVLLPDVLISHITKCKHQGSRTKLRIETLVKLKMGQTRRK